MEPIQKQIHTGRVILEAIMLCLCAVFLIPFYYLLVNTLKTSEEATTSPMGFPSSLNLSNYVNAFQSMNFFQSFFNTLIITSVSVTLIVILGAMAAYPIARHKSKLTKILFFYFLLGFMIPIQSTMIPLFSLMQNMKLQNTIVGLILMYSSWCNFAMFMYQGFLSGVPKDLEEAAMIDGCNKWQSFWKVVFPLLKPVTTTIVIFEVMWIWNDFMYPFLFLSSSKTGTLVLEVYKGVGQFTNNWTQMLCTMVIVLIPVLIFYLGMQKNIIAGITSGAVKG